MIANIIWNAENDSGGIGTAPKPVAGMVSAWSRNARSRLPIHLPVPWKASEYMHTAQSTLMSPRQKKFCISMASTFFARTMPQ
jgi:hypothetical protein